MIINDPIPYVTYKNHYEWGFNDIPFSFRDSMDDVYFTRYGKLTRRPFNWRDECVATARLIYDEAKGDPIRVFFSGGMDSAVVAEAFRLSGVPFTVATIVYNDNWNWHDIKFAIDWCEQYGIKQDMIDCDVIKFWESGDCFNIGYAVQSRSPQYCVHLWGVDQIDGFPVIGLGEGELYRKNGMILEPDGEYCRAWERHLIVRNRSGAGSFFKYTPELKVCQFLDDSFIDWANDSSSYDLIKFYKNEMYQKHFPNLETRYAINSIYGDNYTDYNGSEFLPIKALQAETKARIELRKHFEDYHYVIETEYNVQMKRLLPEELFSEFMEKRKQ